jgi:hypothetical protein
MPERRCRLRFNILLSAEVVEWQTRTFEGRVAKAVRVQVPPSAPYIHNRCSLASFLGRGSGPFGSRLSLILVGH